MTLPRAWRGGVALVTALALVMWAQPAFAGPLAQESALEGDRLRVIVWTLAAVTATMVLLAIGYFYRRAAGVEKPPPVPILEPGVKITVD